MASQIILPKLTYEMSEGRILEWLCKEGQPVSAGQSLFLVETDKATTEVPADESGVLIRILVPAGATVPVGSGVGWIGNPNDTIPSAVHPPTAIEPAAKDVAPPTGSTNSASVAPPQGISATPIAQRMARDLGLDLQDIWVFCGQKRIRESDVQAYIQSRAQTKPPAPKSPVQTPDVVFELVHPSPLQRAMAARMTLAAAVPQMAAGCEVDLTQFEQLKNELQERWENQYGYRLSYTHLMAALIARALVDHPTLNASWTDEGIRLYRVVNLGVAMASERGLVVPVVRDAHRRPLEEIASEIIRLQRAAESNRLSSHDLEGGTFTMTNVGMLGITLSIPLLNPPQSAILGIGAKRTHLTLDDGRLKAIPLISVTVVADHRVVDGAASAAFLMRVKELMEKPTLALGR
jgi:pyruvate dehydrogenase E2 component (dihydrolipoamide acetyltransferase)